MDKEPLSGHFDVSFFALENLLWQNLRKLFIFGLYFPSAVMLCKRKITLKSLLHIKSSDITDQNMLPIHPFSRGVIDYIKETSNHNSPQEESYLQDFLHLH